MAEIRRATEADVEALVELLRLLHDESPNHRAQPYEPEEVGRFVSERLRGATHLVDDSLVLVAVRAGEIVGTLIGAVVKNWFNRRTWAGELVLYIHPEERGRRTFPHIVQAYEEWAAAQGAGRTVLGVSTGIGSARTIKSYLRLGYTLDDNYTASKPCLISE